ncbi:U-box domain-containing protein 44-like isoform X2 [Andrographis paniculata]|uniref:U-box domain-containing protein 44-like isoform X2 n=1 Tax=Andrographis paniculata TaxID=175694 RepID=UPI0021E7755D|nr:U-box domain-containing protein 44-like isoform X2 [Andrographis paniculata]
MRRLMDGFDCSKVNALSLSPSSVQSEAVAEFSVFIDKLNPILTEIKGSVDVADLPTIQTAVDSLESDYHRAKSVVESAAQTVRSSPAKQIEHLAQNLGRSLGLVLFASHEVPIANKRRIEELCKELMNVRFESSSDSEFGVEEEEDETEEEDEPEEIAGESTVDEEEEEPEGTAGEGTVEDETTTTTKPITTVYEAISEIRYGNEQRLREALSVLNGFLTDGTTSFDDSLVQEDVVRVLSSRLSSSQGDERVLIIRILRHFLREDDRHKEKMKDMEFLSTLVKSLMRDSDEQSEAVGLLLSLSDDLGVRRRIGRIQGCIVMLVAISNGDDQECSRDAGTLLNYMSGNTQHALHMAEAGYFKPLIKYLKEEMSKVLMATALSRLELTEQNKASLGSDGAIEPLVGMFYAGNLEAKLSALNALQRLSNSKANIQRLIDSGIVVSLLQLLFSVTSVLMTLREPASAILARVAQSESILVKRDVAYQMLSLLNLSSPVIQNHLLEALNNIVSYANALRVRRKMNENGAIRLLIPFLAERDAKLRTGALRLMRSLAVDIQGVELTEQLGYPHVRTVAGIVATSASENEKVAALGLLGYLPVSDKKVTDILKDADMLPLIVSMMRSSHANPDLSETITGVVVRFTIPTDKRLQRYSAEHGVIPELLKLLLQSTPSPKAKSTAALCLTQLSQNSQHLAKMSSRKLKWLCGPGPSANGFCRVHDGQCSVKGTFCLVRAGAIPALIGVLEGDEMGAYEAALGCIATLLPDDTWQHGCEHLVRARGVEAIVKILAEDEHKFCDEEERKVKEKGLWILERVFRVEEYREEYGESAKGVLIDVASQNGQETSFAPLLGKLFAHLQLLQDQSTYF